MLCTGLKISLTPINGWLPRVDNAGVLLALTA